MQEPVQDSRGHHRGSALAAMIALWLFLFGLWAVLSGMFDAVHLGFGAFSAALVAGLTRSLLDMGIRRDRQGRLVRRFVFVFPWWRLLRYVPWLLWEIVLANLQVAWILLQPRMPIAPRVVRFYFPSHSEMARAALANSITLTPGTLTLDVVGGDFTVHALTESAAAGLAQMARNAQAVFDPGDAPDA
jgi:multicomponent Na+:H+ antiporter subunit E